jgi:hypothetical protein
MISTENKDGTSTAAAKSSSKKKKAAAVEEEITAAAIAVVEEGGATDTSTGEDVTEQVDDVVGEKKKSKKKSKHHSKKESSDEAAEEEDNIKSSKKHKKKKTKDKKKKTIDGNINHSPSEELTTVLEHTESPEESINEDEVEKIAETTLDLNENEVVTEEATAPLSSDEDPIVESDMTTLKETPETTVSPDIADEEVDTPAEITNCDPSVEKEIANTDEVDASVPSSGTVEVMEEDVKTKMIVTPVEDIVELGDTEETETTKEAIDEVVESVLSGMVEAIEEEVNTPMIVTVVEDEGVVESGDMEGTETTKETEILVETTDEKSQEENTILVSSSYEEPIVVTDKELTTTKSIESSADVDESIITKPLHDSTIEVVDDEEGVTNTSSEEILDSPVTSEVAPVETRVSEVSTLDKTSSIDDEESKLEAIPVGDEFKDIPVEITQNQEPKLESASVSDKLNDAEQEESNEEDTTDEKSLVNEEEVKGGDVIVTGLEEEKSKLTSTPIADDSNDAEQDESKDETNQILPDGDEEEDGKEETIAETARNEEELEPESALARESPVENESKNEVPNNATIDVVEPVVANNDSPANEEEKDPSSTEITKDDTEDEVPVVDDTIDAKEIESTIAEEDPPAEDAKEHISAPMEMVDPEVTNEIKGDDEDVTVETDTEVDNKDEIDALQKPHIVEESGSVSRELEYMVKEYKVLSKENSELRKRVTELEDDKKKDLQDHSIECEKLQNVASKASAILKEEQFSRGISAEAVIELEKIVMEKNECITKLQQELEGYKEEEIQKLDRISDSFEEEAAYSTTPDLEEDAKE